MGQTDIVMGNVAPLKKRIAELEAKIDRYEVVLLGKGIDIHKKYVRDVYVEGDLTGQRWSGGDA